MSADGKLGAKKLRQATVLAGEPLMMAFAWSSDRWEVVTPDDRHLYVNPRNPTEAPRPLPADRVVHWTTCPAERPAEEASSSGG